MDRSTQLDGAEANKAADSGRAAGVETASLTDSSLLRCGWLTAVFAASCSRLDPSEGAV